LYHPGKVTLLVKDPEKYMMVPIGIDPEIDTHDPLE
jgi:hypothetical protein